MCCHHEAVEDELNGCWSVVASTLAREEYKKSSPELEGQGVDEPSVRLARQEPSVRPDRQEWFVDQESGAIVVKRNIMILGGGL